ncbi:LEA type 2 family protein [uncultured Methanoregula sp.]|uniref:LEA type 2 family protein n=1 Tax=uncultured Methanoregula sp. TaxID=1005933 RepID=UPI002AAB4C18|nr:LEA type 2 family protein [uncultured Methanoregula sp.]
MFWLPLTLPLDAVPCCGLFIKDPEIKVKNIALMSLSLSSLSLDVTLAVTNPNLIGITIKTLNFNVFYQDGENWTYLTCGSQKDIAISKGSCEITIPVTVDNMKLMSAIVFIVAKGTITLRIKGVAVLSLLGFSPKIPFMHVTTVPLKLPGA